MFFKNKSTTEKVVSIVAIGFLSGVWMSWPLWNETARFWFPTLPVWGEAVAPPILGSFVHFAGPIGLITLLALTFLFPEKKWLLGLSPIWLIGLCAFDLNRLQPWAWFYLLVFVVVFFEKKENEISTANALKWLLAGVYFWSGFNKLTPYFAEDNFAWFCEAFSFTKPFNHYPTLGYTIALFEMSFAAGLLLKKTRPFFRWIVIGFHSVIILFLLKLNWNWVVIPWNVAMAGMVWVLNSTPAAASSTPPPAPPPKGRGGATSSRNTLLLPSLSGEGLGVGLTWLTPILYFFHLWPHTLSWQLYSNTQPEATFFAENGIGYTSIESEQVWGKYAFDNGTKLLLDDWASDELKVPMFASEHTFRQVEKYLCARFVGDSAGLYILTVHRWDKSAEKMEKIPCRELLAK